MPFSTRESIVLQSATTKQMRLRHFEHVPFRGLDRRQHDRQLPLPPPKHVLGISARVDSASKRRCHGCRVQNIVVTTTGRRDQNNHQRQEPWHYGQTMSERQNPRPSRRKRSSKRWQPTKQSGASATGQVERHSPLCRYEGRTEVNDGDADTDDSWREEHEEFISKMMERFDNAFGKADPLPPTPSPIRWVHLEAWGRWQWCTSALIIAVTVERVSDAWMELIETVNFLMMPLILY